MTIIDSGVASLSVQVSRDSCSVGGIKLLLLLPDDMIITIITPKIKINRAWPPFKIKQIITNSDLVTFFETILIFNIFNVYSFINCMTFVLTNGDKKV